MRLPLTDTDRLPFQPAACFRSEAGMYSLASRSATNRFTVSLRSRSRLRETSSDCSCISVLCSPCMLASS